MATIKIGVHLDEVRRTQAIAESLAMRKNCFIFFSNCLKFVSTNLNIAKCFEIHLQIVVHIMCTLILSVGNLVTERFNNTSYTTR